MRTTLSLDADVLAAARAIAESRGSTIGEVMSELARRGLSLRESRADGGNRDGIPLFPLQPGAGFVTPEIIEAFLNNAA